MNILIITPYFYPYENPRSFRWTGIANTWASEGHSVFVVCASWEKNIQTLHQNIQIFPVGHASIWHSINKNKPQVAKTRKTQKKHKGFFLKNGVLSLGHYIWRSLYWPDGSRLWIKKAKQMSIKIASEYDIDVCFSVSIPFSSHIVGKNLKQKHPNIKWIMDVGDPFALAESGFKNNQRIYRKKNLRAEKKCLELADYLAVTTEGLCQNYKRAFPTLKEKIVTIPPLLDKDPNQYFVENPIQNHTFTFIGSFYKGLREPKQLLALFDHFLENNPRFQDKLVLLFYGQIEHSFFNMIKSYPRLEKNINLNGPLPKGQIHQVYNKAGVIINVGNNYPSQIPSKVVEYLATGLPILNVQSSKTCASAQFFKPFASAVSIAPGAYDKFEAFIKQTKKQSLRYEEVLSYIQPFLAKSVSAAYLDLVKQ